MRASSIAIAFLISVSSTALAQGTAPNPSTSQSTSVSFQTSTIGELLENPQAKVIFEKHFPAIVNNPQISQGFAMKFADINQFDPNITPEKLAAMDAELKASGTK